LENGYPPNAYIKMPAGYHPAARSYAADWHRKALSFYTLKNGDTVGIWKKAWTAVSTNGKTWSKPVQAPGFAHTFAKLWGQRTSDGRYAIAYDPQADYRWPLAVVTSKDGITFNHMLVVDGEVPFRRYSGLYKNPGPQYVRGIAQGNPQPPDGAMWLVYSVNKEDIWVSRIPVPIRGTVKHPVDDTFNNMKPGGIVTDWNIYSPRWAPVEVVNFPSVQDKSLELKDGDPYDYARAVRIFPVSKQGEIAFKVLAKQTSGELDVELDNAHGQRAVRITLAEGGQVEVANGSQAAKVASYTAGKWLAFKIDYNAARQQFSVAMDGRPIVQGADFTVPVNTLQKISFRTGPYRSCATCIEQRHNYFFGHVNPRTDRPLKDPAVFYLDNVSTQSRQQ
jgi:hypothetical protein